MFIRIKAVAALVLTLLSVLPVTSLLSVGLMAGRSFVNFDDFEGTFESLPQGFSVSIDGQTTLTDTNEFNGIHGGGTREGACLAWAMGGGNRALGYQPTSDEFTPGYFKLTLSNSSVQTYTYARVSYDVVCLNNEDRSFSLDLEISSDGQEFLRLNQARFISQAARTYGAAWKTNSRTAGMKLPRAMSPGGLLYLRWYGDDHGGSGSRDEFGIDNVDVRLMTAKGTVIEIH